MKSLRRINTVSDFLVYTTFVNINYILLLQKSQHFKSLCEVYRQGSKTNNDADFKYNNKLIELKFIKNL